MRKLATKLSLPIIIGLALQSGALTARAEMREGPACSLPVTPAGGRPPPSNCAELRYVMVSQEVPGLPPGVSATTPDPKCGARLDSPSAAATAMGAFAAAYSGNADVGLMVASLGDKVAQGLVPNNKLFQQGTDTGNCTAIAVAIPAGATIAGQRLAADSLTAGPAECVAGTDCPKAFSRFMYTPVPDKQGSLQYMRAEYINWASYAQVGRLIVFYKMPAGSKDPVPTL